MSIFYLKRLWNIGMSVVFVKTSTRGSVRKTPEAKSPRKR